MQDTITQNNAPQAPTAPVSRTVSPPLAAPIPQILTRRELAWAALGCAVVVTLFLSPALFSGRFLSPADLLYEWLPWRVQQPAPWPGAGNALLSDTVYAYEPWFMYSAQRLHAGALPLWNAYNALGVPFIANMQSQVFYPLNWLYFLWPGGNMLVVHIWLKLLIVTLGMYVLARDVARVGPVPAALAAATFAFGAYIIDWLFYAVADVGAWLPWLWWATARLMARPGPRQMAVLAAVVALLLLSGHPETIYHVGLITALFALFQLWQTGPLRPARIARVAVAGLAAAGLGAGVAAVQLLPFLEYSGVSEALQIRGPLQAGRITAAAYYLWTLISPDWFGNPAHHIWWPSQLNYNESNTYCGVLPLVVAPFALFVRERVQRRLVGFLLLLGVLALGVVYVPAVNALATQVVPSMALTFNFRLVFVVQFALALLAALGVEALLRWAPRSRRLLGIGIGLVTAILLLGGVAMPVLFAHSPFPLPVDNPLAIAAWQDAARRALILVLLSGGMVFGLFALRLPRAGLVGGAAVLLPVLALADLWQARGDFNPTVAPADYYPATPVTRFLQQQAGLFRVVSNFPIFAANVNMVYGLYNLQNYDSINPLSYADMATQPFNQPEDVAVGDLGRASVLSLLNVRYLITAPGDDPNYGLDLRQEVMTGDLVKPISGSRQVGQTFVAQQDNLAQIQVLGATYGGRATGPMIFHLKTDPTATNDLVREEIDSAKLPDNTWWVINFPPMRQARGKSFYFYLEGPAVDPGRATTLFYNRNDVYAGGSRVENGRPASGDLAFRALWLFNPDQPWFTQVLDGGRKGASIYENRQALPRAWLAHGIEYRPDPGVQVRRLRNPAFDRAHTVVLGESLPATMPLPTTVPPDSADTVTIADYQPEAVRIMTNSPAAGLLVLSDQAFPGWQAQVDGQPARIVTADHALRAVYVPAGAHTVNFLYRPVSFALGGALAAVALLVIVLLALWPGWSPWKTVGLRRQPPFVIVSR